MTFYSVDVRGVMTCSQNAGAMGQLNSGAKASNTTTQRRTRSATKEEMKAADTYEMAARANVDLPLRDLAESTGGFLIGDSNDLRGRLRHVNEEISSYYEVSYNPGHRELRRQFPQALRHRQSQRPGDSLPAPDTSRCRPRRGPPGLAPFELPLLKILSDGKLSDDV